MKYSDLRIYPFLLTLVSLITGTLFTRLIILTAHPTLETYGLFGQQDFIAFWTAGKALNPYSAAEAASLHGMSFPPQAFFNPPWSLPLFNLFAVLDFSAASLFFFFVNILLITISICVIFKNNFTHGVTAALFWLPAHYCILFGQLAGVLLFCLTLFLSTKRHKLAGILLLPLTLKPHLFAGLWLLLIAKKKHWRMLLSLFISFIILNLIWIHSNPNLLDQFLNTDFKTTRHVCLNLLTRFKTVPAYVEILFGPIILSCILLLITKTQTWIMAILLSLMFSPHINLPDLTLLLVCLPLLNNALRLVLLVGVLSIITTTLTPDIAAYGYLLPLIAAFFIYDKTANATAGNQP